MRVTIKRINAALQEAGLAGVEIVRGRGYFYFAGGDAASWPSSSEYVYHLSNYTVQEWVGIALKLAGKERVAPAPAVSLDYAVTLAEMVYTDVRDGNFADAMDRIREVLPNVALKHAQGVYKYVLLVGPWAIKVDKGGIMGGNAYVSTVGEAMVIQRLQQAHAELAHHFPKTHIVNEITVVQERCDINPSRTRSIRNYARINELSRVLDIGDTHEYNVGWRGDTPVFIDVQTDRSYAGLPEKKQYGGGKRAAAVN
jgi:hypothetical protein